jgi:hypothetical protein
MPRASAHICAAAAAGGLLVAAVGGCTGSIAEGHGSDSVRPTAAADGTPGAQDERERPARGADEDTTLIPEGPGGERYTPLTPAPAAMRRLTQAQYESSLRDIFGDALVFDRPLEPDERTESFLAVGASNVAPAEQGV